MSTDDKELLEELLATALDGRAEALEVIGFLEDADDFDDQMRKQRCRGQVDVWSFLIEKLRDA